MSSLRAWPPLSADFAASHELLGVWRPSRVHLLLGRA
jgi:hypothetical protein